MSVTLLLSLKMLLKLNWLRLIIPYNTTFLLLGDSTQFSVIQSSAQETVCSLWITHKPPMLKGRYLENTKYLSGGK